MDNPGVAGTYSAATSATLTDSGAFVGIAEQRALSVLDRTSQAAAP